MNEVLTYLTVGFEHLDILCW